ncbi:MAG: flavin reductase family protein [Proteocatella sp.]
MKREFKAGTLFAPVPAVMVSCGDMKNPNVMTVAWTGIVNTKPPMTYISIRPERHSYDLIKKEGCFVINLTTRDLVHTADFCGVVSGERNNKAEKCEFRYQESKHITAPAIKESPVSIECKVKDIIKLGSHHMFLAEIVAINVEESIINHNGKICLDKAELITYLHGEYFELGRNLGKFGFSVNKKRVNIRNTSDSTNKKSAVGRSGKPMQAKGPNKPSSKFAEARKNARSSKPKSEDGPKTVVVNNPNSAKNRKNSKDKYSYMKKK